MNVFLSYASQHKDLVRPVCSTLRAAGFEIFFDETDLPASEVYDDRIREAIQRSDLFVFMLSPEAVQPGRYTLTELLFAQQRWPNPRGRVVAVLPLDTAEAPLPDYLRPLTLQKQVGNLAAEVLATVRRMQSALDAQVSGSAATAASAASAAPSPASSTEPTGKPTPVPPPSAAPAPASASIAPATSAASFASLDLRLRAISPGAYTLSLDGAAQSEALPLPPGTDADALEQALWHGALPAAGVARRDGPGELLADTLPSPARVREVGQKLHDWLFAPALRDQLREPLRRIDRQRGQGLRFVLNTTDAPTLARLPWEFAYDAQRRDFVFADPMKPLVRWLDVDEPLPTLKVEPPLRLLIAVAAPSDRPALAVGDELAHLDAALADLETEGLLETVVLPHASLGALNDALRDFCPHVLHFIGHGDFAGEEGRILLEAEAEADADDDGSDAEQRAHAAAPINAQRFAVLLRNHLQSLRLVFLNSCLGAATSRRDAFGGVAQALVGHGVPAVVAMQFAIPDRIAVALSRHFYRYLASGRPVDESLTAVRALLYAQGHEVEWGAPVLTMRTPDGRLFDIAPAAREGRRAKATQRLKAAWKRGNTTAARMQSSAGGRWTAGLVAGLLLAVLAWWWFAPVQMADKPPDPAPVAVVEPPPPPPVSTMPAPAPMPAEIEQSLRDAVAAAKRQLDANDSAGALDTLERALASAPQARMEALSAALRDDLMATWRRIGEAELRADAGAHQAGSQGAAAKTRRGRLLGQAATLGGSALAAQLESMLPLAIDAAAAGPLKFDPPAAGPPTGVAPASAAPTVGSTPPAADPYIVQRGDTLWSIAGQRYGDPYRWPEIHQANRPLIADPSRIEPGQVLHIPPHPSTTVETRHTVRRGESLWRIAARLYGNGDLWPRIHAANAAAIADPDRVAPGLELRIPATP